MQVTSDCLFHFTTTLKNIENILSKRFRLSYCNEKFSLGDESHDYYFPMVTFCDLPLALTQKHIHKYGSYAIGLSKEWGIRHKLNPVIYIERKSIVADDFEAALDLFEKLVDDYEKLERLKNKEQETNFKSFIENMEKAVYAHINFYRHIKNYEGDLIRNGRVVQKKYRFYDEREWRYVPAYNDKRLEPFLDDNTYKAFRGTTKEKPLIPEIVLDFTASDIKYLIVKSEKDIPKLIRFIKSADNLTKNPDEADVLTTKIITTDQIMSDI